MRVARIARMYGGAMWLEVVGHVVSTIKDTRNMTFIEHGTAVSALLDSFSIRSPLSHASSRSADRAEDTCTKAKAAKAW